MQPENKKSGGGLLLGLGIGAGALIGAAVLCIVFAGVAVWFILRATEAPESATATIDHPFAVSSGDIFDIVIDVQNVSNETIIIDEIWIDAGYLEGITITGSTPAYYGSEYNTTFYETWDYFYDIALEPQASRMITMQASAFQPGDYAGTIEICINGTLSCIEQSLRTVVE